MWRNHFVFCNGYNAPNLFGNRQKKSLACMERCTLQPRYPLWFTLRLSVLKPDSPHWDASYSAVVHAQGSSVSPVKCNKYPVYQFRYLIWNARPEPEPMINGARGAITPSVHPLFYENTLTYIIYIITCILDHYVSIKHRCTCISNITN